MFARSILAGGMTRWCLPDCFQAVWAVERADEVEDIGSCSVPVQVFPAHGLVISVWQNEEIGDFTHKTKKD